MYLVCVGNGSAWGKTNSSVVLSVDGYNIMLDCGSRVPEFYFSAIEKGLIKDQELIIIITHMHGDHYFGLEEMGFRSRYTGTKRPLVVSPLVSDIWESLKYSMGHSPDPNETYQTYQTFFNFLEKSSIVVSDLLIDLIPVPHVPGMPSYGVRVRTSEKTLWYSGDTSCPNVKEIASADIVIHEACLFESEVHSYYKVLPSNREIFTYHYEGPCPRFGALKKLEVFQKLTLW